MIRVQGVATAPCSTHSLGFIHSALCQRVQVRIQKARYVKSPAQADATSNSKSPTPLAPSTGSSASEDTPKFFKGRGYRFNVSRGPTFSAATDDTGALAHFHRRPDGVGLYVRQYNVPDGTKARGVVVFVHGWTWHSGYFAPFADYLTENGFNVVTFDLRSHGLSERVDDIPGYAKDVNDFATDSIAILEFAQQQNAELPCFFWGESFGAQLILLALTRHKQAAPLKALKGFVISGTPVKIPKNLVPPPPVFLALIALGKLFPKQGMPTTMSANFDESFGDVDRIPDMRADPLILWENPRLSMMSSMLRVDRELLQDSKLIDLPFLSLYGDDDIKTEIQYAREMYDDSVSTDKEFKVYEGARHQLLQDKPHVTQAVMQDSLEWFKQRLD